MVQCSFVFKIIEELRGISNKFAVSESDEQLEISFSSNVSCVRKVLEKHNSNIGIFTTEKTISILFRHNSRPLTYDQFISPVIKDTDECNVDLFVHKTNINNIKSENIIYFYIEEFCNNLVNNKTKALEIHINKHTIFLPVSKRYLNNCFDIIPIADIDIYSNDNIKINMPFYDKLGAFDHILKSQHSSKEIINPLFFYLDNDTESELLNNTLNCLLFINTLKLISNSEFNDSLIFRGNYNLEMKISGDLEIKNRDSIYQLLMFVLDQDKYHDKIEITRNAITLYLNDSDLIQKIDTVAPKLLETISTHFQAYIQNKVDNFFDGRKEIINEAYAAAKSSREQTDRLISSINLTLIASITTVISGIFAYSQDDKLVLLSVLIAHLIFFILSAIINFLNSKHKREEIFKYFQDYCSEFSFMEPKYINEIQKKFVEPSLIRLDNTLKLFIRTSISIIILLFVFLLIIIFFYFPKNNNLVDFINLLKVLRY